MGFRTRPLRDLQILHKLPHLAKPRSANGEAVSGNSHISPHHGRSVITGWKPKVTGQHGHPSNAEPLVGTERRVFAIRLSYKLRVVRFLKDKTHKPQTGQSQPFKIKRLWAQGEGFCVKGAVD